MPKEFHWIRGSKFHETRIVDGVTEYFDPVRRQWVRPIDWPGPTPEMLHSPEFERIWQCIRTWDVAVPGAYFGYMGPTGNHVRAILDALQSGSQGTTGANTNNGLPMAESFSDTMS